MKHFYMYVAWVELLQCTEEVKARILTVYKVRLTLLRSTGHCTCNVSKKMLGKAIPECITREGSIGALAWFVELVDRCDDHYWMFSCRNTTNVSVLEPTRTYHNKMVLGDKNNVPVHVC